MESEKEDEVLEWFEDYPGQVNTELKSTTKRDDSETARSTFNTEGCRPVHYAAYFCLVKVMKFLLDNGAGVLPSLCLSLSLSFPPSPFSSSSFPPPLLSLNRLIT